jgi:hypothetical protein
MKGSSIREDKQRLPSLIPTHIGASIFPDMSAEQDNPRVDDEDAQSLAEWTSFLASYARGEGPAHTIPPMPLLPPALRSRLQRSKPQPFRHQVADVPLYTSTTVDESLAREIRLFYCENGFLPPPRAPLEAQRERCIAEYDLYNPQQLANIQTATDLIAACFPGTLCTFSLFGARIQTHFALSGSQELIDRYQLSVGLRIPAEDSLCGHAVLLDNRTLFLPDLSADWRYVGNPFAMAGFKSFVGSSVSLELDPSKLDSNVSGRVGVGTLNICFVADVARLTPEQLGLIDRITRYLEIQLRATWEGHRRTHQAKAMRAVTGFIDEALVETQGQTTTSFADLVGRATTILSGILPEVDRWQFIDTQAIHIMERRNGSSSTLSAETNALSWPVIGDYPDQPIPAQTLIPLLASDATVFGQISPSGLEPYLPVGTLSHLVVPLFTVDKPVFLILASSTRSQYTFPAADISIVRSIGSILRAKAIQNRVLEADAAKTAFLSSISHELLLRTQWGMHRSRPARAALIYLCRLLSAPHRCAAARSYAVSSCGVANTATARAC